MIPTAIRCVGVALLAIGLSLRPSAGAADSVADTRSLGASMLRDLKSAVKSRYFDPQYRGVDLEAIFAKAEARIKEATNEAQMSGILAQAVSEFGDSHTYYIPPIRPFDITYGFETRMVGDLPLVVDVDEDGDAERKGLLPGDRVLTIEGTPLTRANFAAVSYALNVALPRRQLALNVQTDTAPPRRIVVEARVEERRKQIDITEWFDELIDRMRKHPRQAWRYWTYQKEKVVVARLYSFMVTDDLVNELMSKVHDARALILDLRGNPGGSVEALQTAAGAFFEKEIDLGVQKERKGTKALRSRRPKSKRLFTGDVIVLVDSASASSAEVLARVMQIQKRGIVVGDQTAGAVMLAQHVSLSAGTRVRLVLYGVSVTIADLEMPDGGSLEGRGVIPDQIVLPTASDLREGRDPAMARAAKLAGLELSPAAAWSHFQAKPQASPSPAAKQP